MSSVDDLDQAPSTGAADFAAALHRLRISGSAPDGTTVTVTHTGAVVGVHCAAGVPDWVASSVLAACADAHRRVTQRVVELARADLGTASAEAFGDAWSQALGVSR
ncbi:MAG: hypothetical protein ACSLEW_14525 [Nocardioides sp.]